MIKYELLPEQLIYEGTITEDNLFEPEPLDEATALLAHEPEYYQKLCNLALTKSEERALGFPLTHDLVHRELVIMEGTVQAAAYALEFGISMNIAGGTHHAYTSKGSGFCLLNDNAIAAKYLLEHGLAEQILIVDLDVHQGDGTAEIFQDDDRVFTFSMHGESNFPMKKQRSDLDIPLPDGTGDEAYLPLLEQHLFDIVETVQPDFIFYQCGVDVIAQDQLGRLALTLEGCKRRDKLVLSCARQNAIPIVASMGGGYSPKIADIVNAHANTFRLTQELYF